MRSAGRANDDRQRPAAQEPGAQGGPGGNVLQPGRYQVRLVAFPTSEGPLTSQTITFRIK